MYVGEDANYSPDSTSLTVTVRGKSDVELLWSIVVPTQTYAKLSPWSAIRY